jgi:hypothetical protein
VKSSSRWLDTNLASPGGSRTGHARRYAANQRRPFMVDFVLAIGAAAAMFDELRERLGRN